jgi:hypothetical protein
MFSHYRLTCIRSVAGNHTVTQDKPCQLLDGGFDSGFIYVPLGITSGVPEWNLTITDDTKRKLSQT